MSDEPARKRILVTTLAQYLLALVLCVLALIYLLELWNADLLNIPLHYGYSRYVNGMLAFDTSWWGMTIKSMIEHGTYLTNPSVAAPEGFNLYDYPMAESLHYAIMRGISLVFPNWAATFNLYYLLGFPLAALTSLFVLRHFGVSYPSALVASMLFAFLPYHFLRIVHLFLSAYYLIPLLIMVAIWVYREKSVFFRFSEKGGREGLTLWGFKPTGALVICALVGSAGVYYAFFSAFFLLLAGLAAAWRRRSGYPLTTSAALVAVIVLLVVVHATPHLLYVAREGVDPLFGKRDINETEICGLRGAQMVLPVEGHRLAFLRTLRSRYTTPFTNENRSAVLGLIGTAGFLVLLAWPFLRRPQNGEPEVPGALSLFTVGAFLLGTAGGFGAVFATLYTERIRAYTRISIFIAFVCLFAVALLLDRLRARMSGSAASRVAFWGVAALLLVGGLWDQTNPLYAPRYDVIKAQYSNDEEFVRRVEATMPEGAMIFQLPVLAFPEVGMQNQMLDYDHFRAYLHSKTLRWSYGAAKGRSPYLWQDLTAGRPVTEMLEALALAGFQGVWLDRYGYPDGATTEKGLAETLGTQPLVSGNGRLVFFDTRTFNERLLASYTPQQADARRDLLLHPPLITWGRGFGETQYTDNHRVEFCEGRAEMRLHNTSSGPKKVRLRMAVAACRNEPAMLSIRSDLMSQDVAFDARGRPLTEDLTVPPGVHVIRFSTSAGPMPGPKPYAFALIDLSCTEVTEAR